MILVICTLNINAQEIKVPFLDLIIINFRFMPFEVFSLHIMKLRIAEIQAATQLVLSNTEINDLQDAEKLIQRLLLRLRNDFPGLKFMISLAAVNNLHDAITAIS